MHVLVTGGTGVVGRPTVDRLLERGHTVRLLSRHAGHDARSWSEGVEPFPASVGDADSVRGAAEGCDVVLHIAGIVAEDPPEVTFEAINVEGTRHLVREAERAGVRRFLYVSSLGADRGSSDYHHSKHAAEAEVRGFAGDWLILRPGNVYGPGDEVISLLLKMVRTLPAIPLVGDGDQPFQPIWAQDLAIALADAVDRTEPSRVALDLAGGEITSMNDLLDRLERLTDKRPTRVPVPQFVARMGAEMAETLGLSIPIHSDQLTMLAEGNVLDPSRPNALTDVFGITPTPLDEALAKLADALPEQLPTDGTGPLRRHRYWADIRGSHGSAEELFSLVCREFGSLTDENLMKVGVEPGSASALEEGATMTLAIPLRGNIQVRVEEVTPTGATAMTLEGHPLSGAVRFLVEEVKGLLRFEVRTFTRASSLVDLVGMATFGEPAKNIAWERLVQNVVERSGGEAVDGVQTETVVLEEPEAESVEAWADMLVQRRQRNGSGSA